MRISAFMGLDLGGTSAKAGVFDGKGNLLGFGRVPYAPSSTAEGHSEIPIEEIYSAARDASRAAASSADADVRAMAVSSQGQTFVSLDESGTPLHKAIMWYDSRASKEAESLRNRLASTPEAPFIEGISPAAKISWLKSGYPDLMVRARKYLLLPEYIAWRMTGEAVTDPNTASSTGFYADDAAGYSQEALDAVEVSEDQVARIQKSGSVIGHIRPDVAEDWGLGAKSVLVTGSNDQYCGALGAGVCRPGLASETSGTCMALVTLAEQLPEGLPSKIITGRFPIPRYRFFLAYEKDCGLMLDRLRRKFCPGKSFEDLDAEASLIPPGSGASRLVPRLDAPFEVMRRLPIGSTPAHLYRSMIESLSFSLKENVEIMRSCGLVFETIRCIGGGAKSDLWLQMKADVTGLQIERPKVMEAATLGAAILARFGVEDCSSFEECSSALYHTNRTFDPDLNRNQLYEEIYADCRSFPIS